MAYFSKSDNLKFLRSNLLLLHNSCFTSVADIYTYLVYLGQVLLYLFTDTSTRKSKQFTDEMVSGAMVAMRILRVKNRTTCDIVESLIKIRNSIIHFNADEMVAYAYLLQSSSLKSLEYIPDTLKHYIRLFSAVNMQIVADHWYQQKLPKTLDSLVYVDKYYNLLPEQYKKDNEYLCHGAQILNFFRDNPDIANEVLV